MEVQVDIESKPGKLRHHSGSSSVDDGSHVGRCGWTCPSNGCTSSEGKGTSTKWAKEASCASTSSTGGKKSKGKLRKKGGGGTKINETREDMDAQLLEQRSTNSSEFDSPSLSGSLPSVADSHCSHLSSELSCSDPETTRPAQPPCSATVDHHPSSSFNEVTITPMPEVEHDRLEHYPPQSSHAAFTRRLMSSSPPASPKEGSSGTFLYISEEGGGDAADTESEKDGEEKKGTTKNTVQPVSPTKKRCIQTDI